MTLKVQEGTILLGKYRAEKQLGHGAMGYVVAARHVDLDEPRAIKLLLPDALKNADVAERFLREAKACARLKSEHALRVHDFGRLDDGSPVMVMEYLVGEDLQRVLDRRIRLPYDEAASYVLQACEAVVEAHELKIVHRDLKPSNLFLTRRPDGTACVKVLDFGISKSHDDATENAPKLTATNTVMGTPYYMSPEQLRNSKATDARGDIWSLGVILYEFVTGQVPFGGDNFVDISSNVVFREPLPPTRLFADISPEIEKIILRCLEKNPDDRFPSVRELMAALRPLAASRVIVEFASDFGPDVSTAAQMDGDTIKRPERDDGSEETLPAPPRARESAVPKEDVESQLKEAPNSYAKRFLRDHTEKLEAQRIARRRQNAMRLATIVIGAGALVGVVMFVRANSASMESLLASLRARGTPSASASADSQGLPSLSESTASSPPSASVSATAKSKIPSRSSSSHTTPKSSASASSSAGAPSSSANAASSSAAAPSSSAPKPSSSAAAPASSAPKPSSSSGG